MGQLINKQALCLMEGADLQGVSIFRQRDSYLFDPLLVRNHTIGIRLRVEELAAVLNYFQLK